MICKNCDFDFDRKEKEYTNGDTPFTCDECGHVNFPYKAIRGTVFVLPQYKRYGPTSSIIEIPEEALNSEMINIGTVLSVGPGQYSEKLERYVSSDPIKPGDQIVYPCGVPWEMHERGADDIWHLIKICNVVDIDVLVEDYVNSNS